MTSKWLQNDLEWLRHFDQLIELAPRWSLGSWQVSFGCLRGQQISSSPVALWFPTFATPKDGRCRRPRCRPWPLERYWGSSFNIFCEPSLVPGDQECEELIELGFRTCKCRGAGWGDDSARGVGLSLFGWWGATGICIYIYIFPVKWEAKEPLEFLQHWGMYLIESGVWFGMKIRPVKQGA